MVLDSRIGALDRTLGFLFGLGRGLIIVVVAFLFFAWLVPRAQAARRRRQRQVARGAAKHRRMAAGPVAAGHGEHYLEVVQEAAEAATTGAAGRAARPALRSRSPDVTGSVRSRLPAVRPHRHAAVDRRDQAMTPARCDEHDDRPPRLLDLDGDRLREECGVFGIFGHPDAAAITALGLHALQHRGQEAAGIVSFDGKRFHSERRMGLVGDNFSRREVIDRLPGTAADRPRPLFHHRRDHPAQRAAAVRRARRRRLRHRPQRQPDQRPDAAPPARARRRDDAVDHRHRGDPASGRARAGATASSTASSRACASSKAPMPSSA